ncbi:MAG: HAD-IIIA family hydrolase [Puniceicoccales bacterium]|jgi:D-glycero-D-manno-heptose 1,7-bisphosphate phosphatase|nr:HAD-IIIA family hydrolase [Puniceicoccales bacterium]
MVTSKIAIFLDRDGTIIADKNYLKDPDGVELLPEAKDAISNLKSAKCMLFLFSNQSGIGRGIISMDDVSRCNLRMMELLGYGSNTFDAICIAPESPDNTPIYRKPSPRFIVEMVEKFDLAKENCYMVGDKESDILAGINAQINAILIATDGGTKTPFFEHQKNKEIRVFSSLFEFSKWLLKIYPGGFLEFDTKNKLQNTESVLTKIPKN